MTQPTIGFNYFISKHQGRKWNFIVYFYIGLVPPFARGRHSLACQHSNVASFEKKDKMKNLCTFRIQLENDVKIGRETTVELHHAKWLAKPSLCLSRTHCRIDTETTFIATMSLMLQASISMALNYYLIHIYRVSFPSRSFGPTLSTPTMRFNTRL